MNPFVKEMATLIIKGLPNMLGLLILAWVMYQIIGELIIRNRELTDSLLACVH